MLVPRSDIYPLGLWRRTLQGTVESRLYVQSGAQKFGRRTESDVQVKIIFRIMACKVFWMRLYPLEVQTRGTYDWETYNWDSMFDLSHFLLKLQTRMFMVTMFMSLSWLVRFLCWKKIKKSWVKIVNKILVGVLVIAQLKRYLGEAPHPQLIRE